MVEQMELRGGGWRRWLAVTSMLAGLAGCTGEIDETEGPDLGTTAQLAGPMAVESQPASGLAIGALGSSGVVVASAAAGTTVGVDLFVGGDAARSALLGQRVMPRQNAVGWFGAAVALSGPEVAISASHDDPERTQNGYVDLYAPAPGAREPGNGGDVTADNQGPSGRWTYRETIAPTLIAPLPTSSGSTEFGFGRSLSLAGNDLVVGAARFAGGFGRVFVFHRADQQAPFKQVAELQEAEGVRRFDANFGDTVKTDGDTLIVTRPDTPASTGGGSKAGKVYVYVRGQTATWTLQQVLGSPLADGGWDGFGTAAAVAGDLIAVRSNHEAWVFARTNGLWRDVWRTSVGRGDRGSIALGAGWLAVGEPTADVEGATAAGAVRVFGALGGGSFGPSRTHTEPDPGTGRGYGARVAIQGAHLLVGISAADPSEPDSPGAYVETLDRRRAGQSGW